MKMSTNTRKILGCQYIDTCYTLFGGEEKRKERKAAVAAAAQILLLISQIYFIYIYIPLMYK